MPWTPELSRGQEMRTAGEYPIKDLLEAWASEVATGFVDPDRARKAVQRLVAWWRGATVKDITVAACRAYAQERCAAPATVRRELVSVLLSAINHAIRRERLAATERPFVWRPRGGGSETRWISPDEAQRLLEAVRTGPVKTRTWLERYVRLGLATGARNGALLGLRVEHIDWRTGMIDFRAGAERPAQQKGRAIQPILPSLQSDLDRWARDSRTGYIIEQNDRGAPRKVLWPRGPLAAAGRRAGIGHVHPHMLRHSCATWLRRGGAAMPVIAGWLGHASLKSTERYAHHVPAVDHPGLTILDSRLTIIGEPPRKTTAGIRKGIGTMLEQESIAESAPASSKRRQGRPAGTKVRKEMPPHAKRERIWAEMQKQGEFSCRSIFDSDDVDSHPDDVRKFIRGLRRIGYLHQVGEIREPVDTAGGPMLIAPVYRLLIESPVAPRLRADGTAWDPHRQVEVSPRYH